MTDRDIVKELISKVPKYWKKLNNEDSFVQVDPLGSLVFRTKEYGLTPFHWELMIFSHRFLQEFFPDWTDEEWEDGIPYKEVNESSFSVSEQFYFGFYKRWQIHLIKLVLLDPKERLNYFLSFLK